MSGSFDLVVVGSGFAASFFVGEYLRSAAPAARVLVLERGPNRDHAWRVRERRSDPSRSEARAAFRNDTPDTPWVFLLGFGGSSNHWGANTPRMLPEDFRMQTAYGVGKDWPLSYEELEPFYGEVEHAFGAAGPDTGPAFRSRPFPTPAQPMNDPDLRMARAYPDRFFGLPVAKPTRSPGPGRGACCSSMACPLCPVDAKFTVLNGMRHVYADPRVTLRCDAEVLAVEVEAGTARGVRYREAGREQVARGEFVALATGSIFNPHLLQRSGLGGPLVGPGLCTQVGLYCDVLLDGLDSFQGGTRQTGAGYMLYDGPHRARHAGAFVQTENAPQLRDERGKWRHRYGLLFVLEDLPDPRNGVFENPDDPACPRVRFGGFSDYTRAGVAAIRGQLDSLLAPLPVESYSLDDEPLNIEGQCGSTTPMGADPATSVVDSVGLHHGVRNLAVLGSSTFPTPSPSHPTLTLSALALRSARMVFGT